MAQMKSLVLNEQKLTEVDVDKLYIQFIQATLALYGRDIGLSNTVRRSQLKTIFYCMYYRLLKSGSTSGELIKTVIETNTYYNCTAPIRINRARQSLIVNVTAEVMLGYLMTLSKLNNYDRDFKFLSVTKWISAAKQRLDKMVDVSDEEIVYITIDGLMASFLYPKILTFLDLNKDEVTYGGIHQHVASRVFDLLDINV